jgi:hypothetical protein
LSYEQSKRNYLLRVLINKSLNIRLAFKNWQEVPVALFKKGPSLELVEGLVMKSKVTLETSLLRTLFYSFDRDVKQESKLKLARGSNVFVIGSTSKEMGEQGKAILLLSELLKQHIRFAIQQFDLNRKRTLAQRHYFSKMCARYHQSREEAFGRIKALPRKGQVGGVD